MSDHGHHTPEPTPANDEDQRADARGALIVITCLLLMFVHFASGWTF
jgi:hypothetical protein